MRILLFGGTSEGRELAGWLLDRQIPATVSVTTEYGASLLPQGVAVHTGRLDREAMEDMMGAYSLVIDATHPYAEEATKNIRAAAEGAGLPCLRLLRETGGGDACRRVRTMEEAAETLKTLPGNILLATGSKELHRFACPGLVERCFPRVLPMRESLDRCLTLGYPPAHVICMQGPFSKELNLALLRQFDIQTMVTKDTGGSGGFQEKAEAAREAGCVLLVVERPTRETGYSLEELKKRIEELWRA